MYTENNKEYFESEDFELAVNEAKQLINTQSKVCHLVTPYRGGLPLGVRLSNELDVPLSILNYQRYDGDSKEVKFMYNAGISSSECIVLVDDIVDEGVTITKSVEFLREQFPMNKILVYTIFGNDKNHNPSWNYSFTHTGKWITFLPWEGK